MPSLTCRALVSLVAFAVYLADSHQVHQDGDIFASDESVHYRDHEGGQGHDHHDDWCGSKPLSLQEEQMQQLRIEAFRHYTSFDAQQQGDGNQRKLLPTACDELCDQCIEIQIRLNLLVVETDDGPRVPHPFSAVQQLQQNDWSTVDWGEFSSPDEITVLFENNMKVLNSAFAGTPFNFTWDGEYSLGSGDQWTFSAFEHRAKISSELGSDDLRVLDVFVANQPALSQSGFILGMATPASLQEKGRGDGVYVRYDVLTGGGLEHGGLDLGFVLVHEVGHWLGLLHTFETLSVDSVYYDCTPDEVALGDFVLDTAVQKGASLGFKCRSYLNGRKPKPDSCPDLPGEDSIFNFMNYIDDDYCLSQEGEFTCGQKERMFSQWSLFRDRVSSCSDPDEFEVELLIAFGSRSLQPINRVILMHGDPDDPGEIIYDSLADQVYMIPLLTGMTLVDHCVPRSKTYSLVVSASDGNGFEGDGKIEVYVERELVAVFEGNFGEQFTMPITGDTPPILIPEESGTDDQIVNASSFPSAMPSMQPSLLPSNSMNPSSSPSGRPTPIPTVSTSPTSSSSPSLSPSFSVAPSMFPSNGPSWSPSTSQNPSTSSSPSFAPTSFPSFLPSLSGMPSNAPSLVPSSRPSPSPTQLPPSSQSPSTVPTQLTIERSEEGSSATFSNQNTLSFGALLAVIMSVWLRA